jgi:hypothetical protein
VEVVVVELSLHSWVVMEVVCGMRGGLEVEGEFTSMCIPSSTVNLELGLAMLNWSKQWALNYNAKVFFLM